MLASQMMSPSDVMIASAYEENGAFCKSEVSFFVDM